MGGSTYEIKVLSDSVCDSKVYDSILKTDSAWGSSGVHKISLELPSHNHDGDSRGGEDGNRKSFKSNSTHSLGAMTDSASLLD